MTKQIELGSKVVIERVNQAEAVGYLGYLGKVTLIQTSKDGTHRYLLESVITGADLGWWEENELKNVTKS